MDNSFREDIKFNCDVSDAGYWGFFSICGLLMRYRDLFRSEKGLKPWSNIDRAEIAAWIAAKEARWPELEQEDFRKLHIDGTAYSPFDVENINNALHSRGLVYGAGYGMYLKPTFFLAALKEMKKVEGITVYKSGVEYIRDLLTASAMLQGNVVFIRLEPLLILLHYKFAELNVKRNHALEDALGQYGFAHRQLMDNTFEKRLEALAARFSEIILYHEIGEFKENLSGWKDILAASGDRANEHYLRAVKDLIADTSDYGPLKRIIETRDRGALGLTLALSEGFRRKLFPEIREGYEQFLRNGDWDVIEHARTAGYERFTKERRDIMDAFRDGGADDFIKYLKEKIS